MHFPHVNQASCVTLVLLQQVDGSISLAMASFAFALGFALQVVDDLQDTVQDLADAQHTLFTVTHVRRSTLDSEDAARRLAWFLHFVCYSAQGKYIDNGLRELLMLMTWNMVLKAVSRNQTLFGQKFPLSWGPLGPLPVDYMPNLQSLKTLHQLAVKGMI